MLDNRTTENSAHTTKHSPSYGFFDRRTLTSIGIAGVMMLLTIGGMVVAADTIVAEIVLSLYSVFAFLGVAVIGAMLYVGRRLGLKGIGEDNTPKALAGSLALIGTYAAFGGAILTRYPSQVYISSLTVTGIVTIIITVIVGSYVYSRDQSFEQWATYSAYCFGGGFVAALVGSFFSPVLLLAFVLFLLGFLCDLVFEIWMTSNNNRDPKANGIALYIAVAGVFVHILQLVIEE